MSEELSAALGAILASLEGGCEVVDESWGVFVSNPEFPRVHMANFLWLRSAPPNGMEAALRRANDVFDPLRVRHRMVIVGDPGIAPIVVPDLASRGYRVEESSVMVAHRPPVSATNPDVAMRPARDQQTRDDHDTVAGLLHEEAGYDYEVSHQLLALQWRRAAALGREVFTAYLEGEAVGIGSFDEIGRVGVIQDIGTAPARRNRGVAACVVRGLRKRAESRGLTLVCLETPAGGTTRKMYARLGFDTVGPLQEFLRAW